MFIKDKKIFVLFIALFAAILFFSFNEEHIYQAREQVEKQKDPVITLIATKDHKITEEQILKGVVIRNHFGIKKVTVPKQKIMKHPKPGDYKIPMIISYEGMKEIHKTIHVVLVDGSGPKITLKKDIVTQYGEDFNKQLITAIDDFDGAIKDSQIKITNFDSKKVGPQIITITAVDSSNNSTTERKEIQVIDDSKPQILHVDNLSLDVGQSFDPLDQVTASDNADGDITKNIQIQGSVDTSVVNDYQLTYSVTDQSGNTAQVKRKVSVHKPSDQERSNATTGGKEATDKEAIQNESSDDDPISMVSFLGQNIPFIDSTGADEAPATGSGTWVGSGDVNDGKPTYFIGHNPGDFSGVLNLDIGAAITIFDNNGNKKIYHVVELIDIDDYGDNLNVSGDNITDRVLYANEEQIALQTCLSDSTNRVVLAK